MKFYKTKQGGIKPLPAIGEGTSFSVGTDEDGLPVDITNEQGVRFPILEPEPPLLTYKEIKKRYALTDADIGAAFGLSEAGFKTSSAKPRYQAAVENLYSLFMKGDAG